MKDFNFCNPLTLTLTQLFRECINQKLVSRIEDTSRRVGDEVVITTNAIVGHLLILGQHIVLIIQDLSRQVGHLLIVGQHIVDLLLIIRNNDGVGGYLPIVTGMVSRRYRRRTLSESGIDQRHSETASEDSEVFQLPDEAFPSFRRHPVSRPPKTIGRAGAGIDALGQLDVILANQVFIPQRLWTLVKALELARHTTKCGLLCGIVFVNGP
ncbi:hypothetical protein HG531_009231 [Fusarium graminearum]|nr:hypothetical protein HG531_009231 [Fusarium graminearum]